MIANLAAATTDTPVSVVNGATLLVLLLAAVAVAVIAR